MQLNVIHNQDFLRNGLPDHCADRGIFNDPNTVHCVNDNNPNCF